MKYKVKNVVWKTEKAYLESIDADDIRFDDLWYKYVAVKTTVCEGRAHGEAAADFFKKEEDAGSTLVIMDDVWYSYMRRPDGSVCRDITVIGEKPEECDMIGRCVQFCHRPADVYDLYNVKH